MESAEKQELPAPEPSPGLAVEKPMVCFILFSFWLWDMNIHKPSAGEKARYKVNE